ncbi:hypothetical protein IHQ68_17880 [Chelatococcus sambhunathii]|uniref:Uncharacterized protein n=1 Tax=Chelatococcus sambhunathii TaxID=363953 RepID=A0ABU1DK35_9HYPH|nr:hypothetical protein [Chelatococcus sambhunathii]MDR4308492.1 hypothetical protein [Chelatococcus sambhunathii]
MTKKSPRVYISDRQDTITVSKPPSKAAIRSENLRQDAAARGLKQFNFLAPTDSDSRALIREIGDHLATMSDKDLARRRAQLRELVASPLPPEDSGAKVDVATSETLSGRSLMAAPAMIADPTAERLRNALRGRRDAWPLLLEVLKSDQLFQDVELANRRPDAIQFIRTLLADHQARAAALKAARDPSSFGLLRRIQVETSFTMAIIRGVIKAEKGLLDLKRTIINLGRAYPWGARVR